MGRVVLGEFPTGIWWLVVAAVGAATIWSMMSAVHDTGQRREAAVLDELHLLRLGV